MNGGGDNSGGGRPNPVTQRPFARLHRQYRHPDGKERRVPPSWTFPSKVQLLAQYQYWHFGDASKQIPPMKYLHISDVDFLGKHARKRLNEYALDMGKIDKEAASKGFAPHEHMSLEECANCFGQGESIIYSAVNGETPSGRTRLVSKMSLATIVKYFYKKRRVDSGNNV